MRFLFLTMDGNHAAALREAASRLQHEHKVDIHLTFYNATTLRTDEDWEALNADIKRSDFVFGSMLFGEELVRPLVASLSESNAATCVITSNPTLIRCTKLGKFVLKQKDKDKEPGLLSRWMQRFRPKKGHGEAKRQLTMLRNLGKIMKHIPGKARDLHSYIVIHDYWLHASPENMYRLMCLLIERYIPEYHGKLPQADPIHYPDAAIYHPDAPEPFADLDSYEQWRASQRREIPFVGSAGLLSLRTVILSGNTDHLDSLIRKLESRGIEARTAYSAGLDFRPAIEKFYLSHDHASDKGTNDQEPNASVDLLLNGAVSPLSVAWPKADLKKHGRH